MRIAGTIRPNPKSKPVRDPAYRQHVASKPCRACGAVGRSQAAHIREGHEGGASLKPGDDLCIPLCATWPDRPGCHDVYDGRASWRKPYAEAQRLHDITDELKAEARAMHAKWKEEQ